MTNQQGAPEALTDFERRHAIRQGYEIAASDSYFEARPQIDKTDRRKAFQAGFERGWDRHAALVEAQQPATHVQKPAEIEHVAGDVSKNGAESNMAQQPAPSAAVAHAEMMRKMGERQAFEVWFKVDCPVEGVNARIAAKAAWQARAALASIAQAPQPSPTPQADSVTAPATDSYVQPVPDKCDRIVWRGHYYHLPPTAQAADSVTAPAGEVVGYRISDPGEPDLGHWLSEEPGAAWCVSEPLALATHTQPAHATKAGNQQEARPCHVFTVRKAGGLTEWEPTSMAFALPDGAHALYTLPQPTPPAQAADSALEDAARLDWQDISTAPKDGTRFVAVGNNYGLYSETQHICIAQWFRGCWIEVSEWNETSELKYLTHWMPLLPLPGSAARKQGDE